jgi:hypothetical protein
MSRRRREGNHAINRQQRRRIADTRKLVPAVAAEPTWEGRFQMFAAAMQTWLKLGAKHGFDQKEIAEELGGDLARRIVERFDAPPIRDMHQALIYFMSSDPVHRAASKGWQMMHRPVSNVHDRTVSGHDTNVRLFHRDIQAGKILHLRSPLPMTEPIVSASKEEPPTITQC